MKNLPHLPISAILLLGCLTLGIFDTALAQNPKLDSLSKIATESKDTVRIDALIELGKQLRQSNLEQSIETLKVARDEAMQGGYFIRQIRAMNSLGVAYGMFQDYAKALEQFKMCIQLHQEGGSLLGIAEGYNNLGIVYKLIGDYNQSLDANLQALQLYDSLRDDSGRASSLHNIGVVYDMTGDPEQALTYFQKALKQKQKLGEAEDQSLTLHSIGLIYDQLGKYQEALDFLFQSLEISRKLGDKIREAGTLNTIGKVYLSSGAKELAIDFLRQSQEKSIELGLRHQLANTLYNLASIHMEEDLVLQAIPLLEEDLMISQELGSVVLQKQAHALLAEAKAKTGNFAQAYQHQVATMRLSDSLISLEKTQAFQQWQARFDLYEKDRQLVNQQKEITWLATRNKLDRQLRWALIIALVLAGFSALLFYQRYKLRQRIARELEAKNRRIEEQKREIEQINLELERRMLRAQINPHFIFNSLGSIQHFITADDRASALKYLSKFSNLLRQVLEDSVTNQIVLAEEVKLLETYLELEALRFDHSFQYAVQVESNLDPYTTEVPILLIQPYVENAIIHGLLPKRGDRKLEVMFFEEKDQLYCRIQDNGIGRKKAAALKVKKNKTQPSRGMEVTQQRLQALNQEQESSLVTVTDLYDELGNPNGTKVIIKIPL